MKSINDGNIPVGFGDDILILELNEYVSLRGNNTGASGAVTEILNSKKKVIGHIPTRGSTTKPISFTGMIGSTIDVKLEDENLEQISFIDNNGNACFMSGWDIARSDTDIPVISGTAYLCKNGLITSPCRDTGLQVGVDANIALTIHGAPSGGTWTISGVDGLTVNGSNIEGQPTASGVQELKASYSVTVTENGKQVTYSTSRTIDFDVAAAA